MAAFKLRAFIATTLSAQTLVSRVLSPAIFRAETVSFTLLDAMVLSPEALISYVVVPRILEARIGSSEALTFLVLSPGTLPNAYLSSTVCCFRDTQSKNSKWRVLFCVGAFGK